MRRALFLGAVLIGVGCHVSNYPVIFDDAGPWDDAVLDSFYDEAYIVPTGQVATIWTDGSDETFSEVVQDWKGDQWIYTYNNFDPTASVIYLDQTYCDPARQTNCANWVSWNPDLPEYTPGRSPEGPHDDPFDGVGYPECPGYRSLCQMISMASRIGECGSGLWADKQGLADEFSRLELTTWRGRAVYALPLDASTVAVELSAPGETAFQAMPVYGRFSAYVDTKLRLAVEVTPNVRYQARWLQRWTEQHGEIARARVTYGSLVAEWDVRFVGLSRVLDRL